VFPDTEKNFLRDVLGLGVIAQHAPGKTHHTGEVTANEFGRGALVADADTAHQILVRIPHGWDTNSEK
jgi:hypothetical protein